MDIIFEVNHSQNSMKSRFVGINNEAFISAGSTEEKDTSSTFGIRFFAWSAAMFSQDSMNGVKIRSLMPNITMKRLRPPWNRFSMK